MRLRRVRLLLALMALAPTVHAFAPAHELASLHVRMARDYAAARQFSMALESAERAVAMDPYYAPAWLARAQVEADLAHDEPAERDFRRALALSPGDASVNERFGRFLCERGRGHEAMGYLAAVLADPLNAAPQSAYFNLGQCSRRQGQLAEALRYFRAGLQQAPDDVPTLRELAALYLELGRVKLASFYYGRLMQYAGALGPDDLWKGVRVARMTGDRVREARYAEMLQKRYPDSKETQQMLSGT